MPPIGILYDSCIKDTSAGRQKRYDSLPDMGILNKSVNAVTQALPSNLHGLAQTTRCKNC